MRITTTVAIAFAVVSVLVAADATYLGRWKLNPDRSQLTGDTMTIEKTASGPMRMSGSGFSYIFNVDGREYSTPDGGTVSWKALEANSWEATYRMNGKLTSTVKMSLQGNTQTAFISVKKPDGGTEEMMTRFTRVSGGSGLVGKWKRTEVKFPAASPAASMELIANGTDGLTLKFPEEGSTCTAKFDGKDYPVTGPLAGNKKSLSMRRTGPRSFEITEKLDGKAMYQQKFSLSEDSNELVVDITPVSVHEPTKAVYDRQ